MKRRYRARVAVSGASTMADGVAFTLDLSDLTTPPVATGVITHPIQGRTEVRPFQIRALFPDSLIANMVADARWTAIGRLVDVAWQDAADDPDTDPWTIYGTGRISAMGEPDGRGMVELEVSDESWRARRSSVFVPDPDDLATTQNTTQLWPSGVKKPWRDVRAAPTAAGTRVSSSGSLHRIKVVAGGSGAGKALGREVTEQLHRWIEGDTKDEVVVGADAEAGNFEYLRLNYAGTDYEVVSFHAQSTTLEITPDLLGREVRFPNAGNREVIVHAWVYSASTPPASGDAYLHAPAAPPSEDLPLHIGLDWPTHRWGVDRTWGWMHLADMTRRYFDLAGVAYDEAALTASEGDFHIPLLAYPLREDPEDEWKWFEDEIWGPLGHIVLRDREGKLKLIDLRLPQDVDPDTLLVLDAGNTNAHTWTLVGRETVTSVTYHYLDMAGHPAAGFPGTLAFSGEGGTEALDGFSYKKVAGDPVEADSQAIQASGRRNEDFNLFGVLSPAAVQRRRNALSGIFPGPVFVQAAPIQAHDLLDIYQDGAWRMSFEIDGSVDVSEGQECILDMASIKKANPDTSARTGFRMVRILSLTTHPSYFEADVIDLGPKLVPLATPSISLSQNADRHVVVTLSGTPAGAKSTVEVTYTDSTVEPDSWVERRGELGDGDHVFRDPPREGYAHARVRTRAPNRIRSPWVSPFPMPLLEDPQVADLQVAIDDTGTPTVFGNPNAATQGVRLRFVLHDAGAIPVFPEAS